MKLSLPLSPTLWNAEPVPPGSVAREKTISSATSAALPALLNAFSLESLVSGKLHIDYYTGCLNLIIAKLFNWAVKYSKIAITAKPIKHWQITCWKLSKKHTSNSKGHSMKKYSYFDGLLVIHPLISARYSSSITSVKNSNTHSPPFKRKKHTQAVIPAVQNAPYKKYIRNIAAILGLLWLWLLVVFYAVEKRRRFRIWQFETGQ